MVRQPGHIRAEEKDMRRRPSVLLTGITALAVGILLGASSARLTADSGLQPPQRLALMASGPQAAPQGAVPPPEVNRGALAAKAVGAAQRKGADLSVTMLDRQTGQWVSSGDRGAFPIASVTKLFIADDLLWGLAKKRARLSPADRKNLESMLRSSDDGAANIFWERGGRNAIMSRVLKRYKLTGTTLPYDGNWWTTMSTTADLVRYYDALLDGSGGLPPQQAEVILSNLAASTPLGVDGYPQRFGIPYGLPAESVAVKQGWMCCWGGPNQVHVSTGVIGKDRRYVIAIAAMQPVDEVVARNTITQAIKTMFPGGRI
jgi:hypothetical protein